MILFKSLTIITACDTFQADILVAGEQILAIGRDLTAADAELVDCNGLIAMPGGVDPHTHFDLPMFGTVSSDDHYTGHKAAALGGTTTVIDFVPLLSPFPTGRWAGGENLLSSSIQVWRAKADPKAAIDFGFHVNITHFDERIAAELVILPELGVTSIKVFTAYNNRLRLDDGDIFRVMRRARDLNLLTLLHAENGDVIETLTAEALQAGHISPEWHARTRPAWGAVEATLRGISFSAQTGAPLYIVHMNAAGEVDMLEYARQRGLLVMGETCPQYLFFTEDDLRRPDGAKWICSPPMRAAADNVRLWDGLTRGTIQTIGTDHCPFFYDGTRPIVYEGQEIAIPGKELGRDDFTQIPNGLPGVADRLPVLWTRGVRAGKLTPNQFVAFNSTNPAKIFGLYPRKGALLPGSDADIVLWNPERAVTYGAAIAQHRTDYNLYEGWALTGMPEKVYLRGRLIVDRGDWLGRAARGSF